MGTGILLDLPTDFTRCLAATAGMNSPKDEDDRKPLVDIDASKSDLEPQKAINAELGESDEAEGIQNIQCNRSGTTLDNDVFIIYSTRWYVLLVFSVISFMQSGLCTVWTVIAETVEVTFGWTDSEVSLMQSWFYITYLVAMFPFAWLMDTKGLCLF